MIDISFCIITKNESGKLEKCLKAIRAVMGGDAEIVVVDTGSTDNTCSMVAEYTDKVFHFEWIGDFAAAKNYAASCASNDMVWIMDSDEYLRPLSDSEIALLYMTVEKHREDVGRMCRINDTFLGDEVAKYTDYTNRIFDRRRYCFEGKIHEQLVRGSVFTGPFVATEGMSSNGEYRDDLYTVYKTNAVADHDGYVGTCEERKNKAERNAKLLLEQLKERPDDAYILYQAGKAFFMMEDYDNAVTYFERATGIELNPELEYVADLVETYGYALINSGHPETAILLEGVADDFGASADFNFMLGIAYMQAAQFDKSVSCFLQATRCQNGKIEGVDSYLAWYNIGVIFECLGDNTNAKTYYEKCGDYHKALEGISRMMG